jgi:hypothetical protein
MLKAARCALILSHPELLLNVKIVQNVLINKSLEYIRR